MPAPYIREMQIVDGLKMIEEELEEFMIERFECSKKIEYAPTAPLWDGGIRSTDEG
jgi:hypothetical protein